MKAVILVGLISYAVQVFAQSCGAPELVASNNAYNVLVCSGIEEVERGEYLEAAKLFEDALRIRIHEQPNFELYPRLALAYHFGGEDEAARLALEKANLSLMLFAGVAQCSETASGYVIEIDDEEKFSLAKTVARTMCGAAFDGAYVRRGLDRLKVEAKLLDRYMMAETQIVGK